MIDRAEQDQQEDTDVSFCAQEGLAALEVADLPQPDEPLPTSRELEKAITFYSEANECLRITQGGHDEWYFDKSRQKLHAVRRLMQETNPLTGKQHSATSAEAVVETDPEYRAYLERGSTLTLMRMHMEAALLMAEARMTYIARRAGRST